MIQCVLGMCLCFSLGSWSSQLDFEDEPPDEEEDSGEEQEEEESDEDLFEDALEKLTLNDEAPKVVSVAA